MLKFNAPLIVVDDMARSRHFYEQLLDQKVKFDFGPNVQFDNFSIHLKSHFQALLGEVRQYPVTRKANWGELYFEADEIDLIHQCLNEAGVEFIHPICEQPWGQRVMRLYDPDGHIVEIGETMEAVVQRLYEQGLFIDLIMERTGMPREFVEQAIQAQAEPPPATGG